MFIVSFPCKPGEVDWLHLLFPPYCQGCGTFGHWICTYCYRNIVWLENPQHLPPLLHPSLKCIWSVAEYESKWGRLIQKLKYDRLRILAPLLANTMTNTLSPNVRSWGIEALVPVPLHRKRYVQRGFNQTFLLAKTIGNNLDLLVDNQILERHTWTGTQASQNKDQRHALHTMFRCRTRSPYKVVCLVDDVCTTGATLSACARALSEAGTQTVVALTLAKA